VEDAHCRTPAVRLFTLAWRRQGPCGGLCKPQPPRFGGRQAGDAAAAARALPYLLFVCTEQAVVIILVAASGDDFAVVMIEAADDPA